MNYVYTATKLVKFFQTNVTIIGKLNEKPRRTQKKAKRGSLLTTPQKGFQTASPSAGTCKAFAPGRLHGSPRDEKHDKNNTSQSICGHGATEDDPPPPRCFPVIPS